ncbi:MAG: hypothetical protein NTU41_00760, partial [Chloroflexi bacterium]|nr:hypothetical protein [Chloroflexota bacterium]
MVKKAQLGFTLEPRDDALHPSNAPGWWEWWYFDAHFDNGYSLGGTFHFGSPRPPASPDVRFIEISLYDPEGNKRAVRKRYPKEQCRASEDTCQVVIGPNIYEGDIRRYHLSFQEGGQGCDLVYESLTDGFAPRGPTSSVGTASVEWVVPQARARVTGTITWDGRVVKVSGVGYHDHNWSDAPMSGAGDAADLLAMMGLIAGDWTLVCSGGRNVRRQSREPYGVMYAFKKEKLVAISEKGGGTGGDYVKTDTGIERPQTYRLSWHEPGVVEGAIDFRVKKVIDFMDLHSRFAPFQRWFAENYVGRPAYFRYFVDYTV